MTFILKLGIVCDKIHGKPRYVRQKKNKQMNARRKFTLHKKPYYFLFLFLFFCLFHDTNWYPEKNAVNTIPVRIVNFE